MIPLKNNNSCRDSDSATKCHKVKPCSSTVGKGSDKLVALDTIKGWRVGFDAQNQKESYLLCPLFALLAAARNAKMEQTQE
jgi:hypothetical protein